MSIKASHRCGNCGVIKNYTRKYLDNNVEGAVGKRRVPCKNCNKLLSPKVTEQLINKYIKKKIVSNL